MYYFYDFYRIKHTILHDLPIGYNYSYFRVSPSFYTSIICYLGIWDRVMIFMDDF